MKIPDYEIKDPANKVDRMAANWIPATEPPGDDVKDDFFLVVASGRVGRRTVAEDCVMIAEYWGDHGWYVGEASNQYKVNVSYWALLPDPPEV